MQENKMNRFLWIPRKPNLPWGGSGRRRVFGRKMAELPKERSFVSQLFLSLTQEKN